MQGWNLPKAITAARLFGKFGPVLASGYPALSSRPPIDSNSVNSGPAEIDPVLRAPLPQNRFLGLVREACPPVMPTPSPSAQCRAAALSAPCPWACAAARRADPEIPAACRARFYP